MLNTRLGKNALKALSSLMALMLLVVGVPTAANADTSGAPAAVTAGTYTEAQIEQALAYSEQLLANKIVVMQVKYDKGTISGGTDANPTVVTEGQFDANISYKAQELDALLANQDRAYANNERRIIVGFESSDAEVTLNLDFAGAMAQLRGVIGIFPVDGHPGLLEVVFHDDMASLSTPEDTFGTENFDFTADLKVTGEYVGKTQIDWSGKGAPSTILVTTSDAKKLNLDESNSSKSVPNGDLSRFITSSYNPATGQTDLVIDEAGILAQEFTFTVTRETVAGGVLEFTDTHDADWLLYNAGSFAYELSTWDDLTYGYITGEPTESTGVISPIITGTGPQAFAASMTVPANSRVTFTYKMRVDPSKMQSLVAAITASHDAVTVDGEVFGVVGTNTAKLTIAGKETKPTATVNATAPAYAPPRPDTTMQKGIASPNPFNGTQFFEFKSPGSRELVTSVPVNYSFAFDLSSYDPSTRDDKRFFGINSSVLFSDTLPSGTTWAIDTSNPLTINGVTLAYAGTGTPGVRQYTIDAAKQKLTINFGASDLYKNWAFELPALISTVQDATLTTGPHDYLKYVHRNTAGIQFTAGNPSAQVTLSDWEEVILWDRNSSDGSTSDRPVDDAEVFSKNAQSSLVTATPGKTAKVTYDVVVQRGTYDQEIDVRDTEIVDFIDTSVFDMDTALENVGVTAKYNGSVALTKSDFELVWDGAAETLTIKLTTAGKAKVGNGDKKLALALTLTTHVVKAGQILQIENSAEYRGTRGNPGVYRSTSASSASSSGSGTFFSKATYDWANDLFSKNLRVEHDGNGNPVEANYSTHGYLYRVALVVPTTYRGVLPTLDDTLANGDLEFMGFVKDPSQPTVTTTDTQIDLGRGVFAKYEDNQVKIGNPSGTIERTDAQGKAVFWAYYLAKPKNPAADVSVINTIGGARTAVTVTNKFPLSVAKVDSTGTTASITDLNARFTVEDLTGSAGTVFPSGNAVVTVQAGQLVILDTDTNAISPLMVDAAGQYRITETTAPSGFFLSDQSVIAEVDARGVTDEVALANDPILPSHQVLLEKRITGGNLSSTVFNFDWRAVLPAGYVGVDCASDAACEATAKANGEVLTSGSAAITGANTLKLGDFPAGTVISVSERAVPTVAGHRFDRVTFSGGSGSWSSGTGEYTVTVGDTAPITVIARNEFTPHVWVGDYVWFDANRDGIQNEAPEHAIPGVKLLLTLVGNDGNPVYGGGVTDIHGNPVVSTVTDADGWYNFGDLPVTGSDKKYKVSIDMTDPATIKALEDYAPTKPSAGSDRAVDSSTGSAISKNLPNGGDHDPTLDFGFVTKSYAVGDKVWIDADRDGIQDAGEVPLSGVTVTLTDAQGAAVVDVTGAPVAPVTTDANGRYKFDNLPAGDYKVQFVLTAKQGETYMYTSNEPGNAASSNNSDGVVDSNPLIAITPVFTLDDSNAQLNKNYADQSFVATQGFDPTWDAGVHLKNVSIGDLVWVDENRDGLQDAGEPGIEDVTLTVVRVDKDGNEHAVTDVHGAPVVDQKTDASGIYNFIDLPALESNEKYVVKIIKDPTTIAALDPYIPTLPGVGTDRSKDSNTDFAEATHAGLQEDKGHNPTLDFGFITKSYAVGDIVWIDVNRDGKQDFSGTTPELPLAGVTVELFVEQTDPTTGDTSMVPAVDVLQQPVGERITDANGRYLFDNLPTGKYEVKYTLTPAQSKIYMFTAATAATASDDSDAHVPTLAPGASAPARSTGTSAQFTLDDTSVVKSNVYTDQTFTATQGIDPTWDAGVHLKKVSVGDRVWVDENRDGLQDQDGNGNYTEPGIPGVVLEIVRVNVDGSQTPVTDVNGNPVGPVTTGPDGDYEFTDLPALEDGTSYKVIIDSDDPSTKTALQPYVPTLPGEGKDRAADSSTGSEIAPAAGLQEDGAEDRTLDFGFVVPSYGIGDRVWIDLNRDGIQGAGEEDLAGVTVTLLDATTGLPVTADILGKTIKPQVTGKDGLYMFDNLPAGSYKVQFELTAKQGEKYQFTANVAGLASVDNSDGVVSSNPLVGTTRTIVLDDTNKALTTSYAVKHLASQGIDPTWDAGVHLKRVSIGDYVWFDTNNDGLQGGSEKGIGGVKLVLTDQDGNPVTDVFGNVVEPVWTDANGKYTFENLPALVDGQEYVVTIDESDAKTAKALLGLMPALEGAGLADRDSSSWFAIATFTGLTEDGDRNPTLDFGFVIDPDFDVFGDDETRDEEEDTTGGSGGAGGSDGDNKLKDTGFGGLPAAILAGLLLAVGGVLIASRRKVQ